MEIALSTQGPGILCEAHGTLNDARFTLSQSIDLTFNRTRCEGVSVWVVVYTYMHHDDTLIDIDDTPEWQGGEICGLPDSYPIEKGCYAVFQDYTVGTTFFGASDGRNDGFDSDEVGIPQGNFDFTLSTLT